jgi:hypothetical protein
MKILSAMLDWLSNHRFIEMSEVVIDIECADMDEVRRAQEQIIEEFEKKKGVLETEIREIESIITEFRICRDEED